MEIIEEDRPKTPRDRVKFVANAVVGISVTTVVKGIIRKNFVPKSNLQSAELMVAAYVMGGMLAKSAEMYTDDRIDKVAEFFGKIKKDVETLDTIDKEKTDQ